MHSKPFAPVLATLALAAALPAWSQTEIQWWHSMGGALGERLNAIADQFNASQKDYKVLPAYKGSYPESMTAAIAAFRAGNAPHILQVFEVGTATMMAAKGAVNPVYEVMASSGAKFDPDAYIGSVKGYYTSTDGKMLSLPFNSSTPVLWVNRDALKAAGIGAGADLSTWQKVGVVLDQLKASGHKCPLTTAWQSWIHLENFSAYHNIPFATKDNGIL